LFHEILQGLQPAPAVIAPAVISAILPSGRKTVKARLRGEGKVFHFYRSVREDFSMARCDQGYLCDVCGQDVEQITDSDLYLRYILGEVSPLQLPSQRERHIRCNPAMAQYIIDPNFEPVQCQSLFAKDNLDPAFVRDQERQVTRAWHRLQEIPTLGIPITEYPLPEVLQAWEQQTRKPILSKGE
jgi:hypothetical protein